MSLVPWWFRLLSAGGLQVFVVGDSSVYFVEAYGFVEAQGAGGVFGVYAQDGGVYAGGFELVHSGEQGGAAQAHVAEATAGAEHVDPALAAVVGGVVLGVYAAPGEGGVGAVRRDGDEVQVRVVVGVCHQVVALFESYRVEVPVVYEGLVVHLDPGLGVGLALGGAHGEALGELGLGHWLVDGPGHLVA